jgi:hypothetical protein
MLSIKICYFLICSLFASSKPFAITIHKNTKTYSPRHITNRHIFFQSSDMDSIVSTIHVGATVACVIVVFSATINMGIRISSPLTDLIHQYMFDGLKNPEPNGREVALVLTGVISVFLALVTVVVELAKFDETVLTMWIFNISVIKGCAGFLVASGLLRLVLVTRRWLINDPTHTRSSHKTPLPIPQVYYNYGPSRGIGETRG